MWEASMTDVVVVGKDKAIAEGLSKAVRLPSGTVASVTVEELSAFSFRGAACAVVSDCRMEREELIRVVAEARRSGALVVVVEHRDGLDLPRRFPVDAQISSGAPFQVVTDAVRALVGRIKE